MGSVRWTILPSSCAQEKTDGLSCHMACDITEHNMLINYLQILCSMVCCNTGVHIGGNKSSCRVICVVFD